MKHQGMSANNYQAGDGAQTAAGLNDSLLSAPPQQARTSTTGHAGYGLHDLLPDRPSEWKCVQLEPQVVEILETMDDPLVAHDSGVIIGFNERVPELLGCPAEKLLWRRLSKFIESDSHPTLTRWIEAPDSYSILVSGVRAGGECLLLRLETIASLLCPGGRRIEVVALVEFGPAGLTPHSRELDSAPRVEQQAGR